MSFAENPRAVAGANQPDHAASVVGRLQDEYANLARSVTDALDEARALPASVDDEETQSRFATVIKKLRDLDGRLEGVRIAEKEPYLRSGNAVDSWFGALRAKLFRKNKNDKFGAADVLQDRVNDYVGRKETDERRRREAEARKHREAEDKLRRERLEAERIQREEEARASRARKVENEDAARVRAAAAEFEANRLRDEEERVRALRRQADADASAKTADLVRTRTDGGHMVTARQVPYVEVTDRMQLDFEQLKPFFKDDAVLAALKAWCKTTQHRKQMPGAIIEMRSEAVVL